MRESNQTVPPSSSSYQDVVVITGNIGSGKTSVANLFLQFGAVVVRADSLAHQVLQIDGLAYKDVLEAFGSEVLAPDHSIDRSKLGAIVFAAPEKRKQLEAITHPRIRQLAEREFQNARENHSPLTIYDCPLFYEGLLNRWRWKRIILVYAEAKQCLERIMTRDGITFQKAEQRLKAQLPIQRKAKKADIVLENTGPLELLEFKISQIFDGLRV